MNSYQTMLGSLGDSYDVESPGETHNSLAKLMVSYGLWCSLVTSQIAFEQQDLHSTPELKR